GRTGKRRSSVAATRSYDSHCAGSVRPDKLFAARMRLTPSYLAPCVAALGLLTAGSARALPPGYVIERVRSNVDFPGQIRFAPDGRMFYLEVKTGRVMVSWPPYQVATQWAFLKIDDFGERGLLGLALHPQFADSHYVYVY